MIEATIREGRPSGRRPKSTPGVPDRGTRLRFLRPREGAIGGRDGVFFPSVLLKAR